MSLASISPRLPSPPPPAEIQIGPKSPMMRPSPGRPGQQMEQLAIDAYSRRRIHPGTKAVDMATGPPLVPLQELDSAFQLQEHLAALHYHHTAHNTSPITRENARLMATPPQGIDKTLWLYELCRFLVNQCNSLIVGFLFDTPPCSAATCPEMRASEWQFLCAVHDTPKSCCAIDYCCHTLDWAANVVTNPKIFPSRFVVDSHDKTTAIKNLVNVFRRLHRIFAHAWFQHRGVFWSVENQSGLYVFFKTVCDVYDLLPAENYKLPPEAEGLDIPSGSEDELETSGAFGGRRQSNGQIITIAKPPGQRTDGEDDTNYSIPSRTNTRRHIKSSPSVGSAITSVPEADEDDNSSSNSAADLTSRLREMRISAEQAALQNLSGSFGSSEEVELSSIPVIVEHGSLPAREPPVRPSSVIPPPGVSVPIPQQQQHDLEMSFSPELEEEEPRPLVAEVTLPEKGQREQREADIEEEVSSASSVAECTPELSQSEDEHFEEFLRKESRKPPATEASTTQGDSENKDAEGQESEKTTDAEETPAEESELKPESEPEATKLGEKAKADEGNGKAKEEPSSSSSAPETKQPEEQNIEQNVEQN